MLHFQSDGKVQVDEGEPQGSWHTLSGNRMSLTFNEQTYILRFEGSHRALVEDPKTEPRPAMLYGGKDLGENPEDWTQIFHFPAVFPKQHPGFIGFSGYTGSKTYAQVDVHRIETLNFNEKSVGEDAKEVLEGDWKAWTE